MKNDSGCQGDQIAHSQDMNDSRIFFAAERTLLAWNRTSLALMAFGFVIERFGLFTHILLPEQMPLQRGISFWVGIAFVVLGAGVAILSAIQYRGVLKSLKPAQIPGGYVVYLGVFASAVISGLGFLLTVFLFFGRAGKV